MNLQKVFIIEGKGVLVKYERQNIDCSDSGDTMLVSINISIQA